MNEEEIENWKNEFIEDVRSKQEFGYVIESQIEIINDWWLNKFSEYRASLRAEIEKKIRIHQEIMDTHEIYPGDWHRGNIQALEDIINQLLN